MRLVNIYNTLLVCGILFIWSGGLISSNVIYGLLEHNVIINSLILIVFISATIWCFCGGVGLFSKIKLLNKLKAKDIYASEYNSDDRELAKATNKIFGKKFHEAIFAKNEYDSIFKNWKDSVEWKPRILEYVSGTLIGLGLLGTFIGLMRTLGNVFGVLGQDVQGKELVAALGEPLAGMSVAFSASMLGLGTSLITGLIAMIVAKIISEYTKEVENWLHLNVKEEFFSGQRVSDVKNIRKTVDLMKDIISLLNGIKDETASSRDIYIKSQLLHESSNNLIEQIENNTKNLSKLDDLIIKTNIDVKNMLIQNNQRLESLRTMVNSTLSDNAKEKADIKQVYLATKNKIDELNQNINIKNKDMEKMSMDIDILKEISKSSLDESITTRSIIEASYK